MHEREPRRLLDDPALDDDLRTLLEAARPPSELPRDKARSLAVFAGRLGVGGGGVGGAAATKTAAAKTATAASLGTGTKVGLAALALIVSALGGAYWVAAPATPEPRPAAAVVDPVDDITPGDAPRGEAPMIEAPVTPEADRPEPDGAEPPAESHASPRSIPRSRPTEPAPTAPASLAEEARILEAARGALATDPSAALARANEHRRRFARPRLAAERELIRVQALIGLGRRAEALRVANRLIARDPDGFYARRARALTAP